MKTKIILFFCIIPFIGIAQADSTYNPKFLSAMQKQIAVMDTASQLSTWQSCYNGFERLAGIENKQWLPPYYMAFCILMQSYYADTKKVDEFCDNADRLLAKADSISPNNSEIHVLKAISASARIRVNPMSRGAKFGKLSSQELSKAASLDSLNPRVDLTQGQGLFYTPPAFGGGKDKAKPVFESSVKKYGIFVPASSIAPAWGRKKAEDMLAQCK
jgi:hypothetical protein